MTPNLATVPSELSHMTSDCRLQLLCRAEGKLAAGGNLDGLAGCGIAAHACGPVLDLDHAEAADPHPLSRFEAGGYGLEYPGLSKLPKN